MAQKKWAKAPSQISEFSGQSRIVHNGARGRWAIEELHKAGYTGNEALRQRWAAYIWAALNKHRIPIRKQHGSDQAGRQKRRWLDCGISPLHLQEGGGA